MAKKGEKVKTKVKNPDRRIKISHRFINALSIVSIIGFIGIITDSFFNFDSYLYVESLLMFIIGVGLVIEVRLEKLKTLTHGLTSNNITYLITVIIGFLAIIAGILSFPLIRWENAVFSAMKGILSIIAIVIIIVQTWIIE